MLREVVDRQRGGRRLAVVSDNRALKTLLEMLLGEWGVGLVAADAAHTLLQVGDCRTEPGPDQAAIPLRLPINLEALWQRLEQHFHQPPRMHMRKAVDLAARVELYGEWHETRLSSLSDMGARFMADRELIREEAITVEFAVEGVRRRCPAKVIFSMRTTGSGQGRFQAGVVFSGQEQADRDTLRDYLIREYLLLVRLRMDAESFASAVACFDFTPAFVASLQSAGPVEG